VAENTASALFGVEGLRVFDADVEADGTVTVWALTDHPGAASCPDCGAVSGRVHEYVLTRPRDLRRGLDEIAVAWCKRRWKCASQECARRTFTESLPAIPPRCRLTSRLRDLLAAEVAGRGCTVAEAGRWQHVSWPVTHAAFAEQADPVLAQAPALVAHLGIDEHRRGRPRWRIDEETGEYLLLADRWHTCFFDLPGDQGLLGQVEGRTADDAAYWLAQAPAAWRDAIEVVAIGMCTIYAPAVRRMLPAARLVVDLFHVVQLAVKVTGDVRRRVVREKYRRRGRSGDPEYGVKSLLVRNLEHLSPAQFAKVLDTLGGDRDGQEILAAWIAKEKLRDVINLRARVTGSAPCERAIRGRLFAFYDWCARHDDIPGLASLARTIARWEDELIAATLTGVTNARSESLNRIAKLEARNAYSFRNPANQRRRVRTACTRGRSRARRAAIRRTRLVTGRPPDPG
jgi:transposase